MSVELRTREEAMAVRASIGWPAFAAPPPEEVIRRQLDAILRVGMFYFSRCQEPREHDRLEAWLEAFELFSAVYPLAPGAVPEPLRPTCAALTEIHHAELHNEAIDVLETAELSRSQVEVDQAIWLLASATFAARQDEDRARHLSVLGSAWSDRFRITGRAADLDNAIAAHRRALTVDVGAPDQAGHQSNYSAALLARFENTGNAADLDAAVAAGRAAVETAGPATVPAFGRAVQTSQAALAAALMRRYQYRTEPADLDWAIVAGRRAVAAAPSGDPARPGLRANLANILLERFIRSWRLADLIEAMADAQAAAAAAMDSDPARAVALSVLSLAHLDHFAYSGNPHDLDLAIQSGRDAVAATGDGHPGEATCLSNLGGALRTRYERTGDTGALSEAITLLRRAVRVATADHVSTPDFLNNLGNALRSRFDASGGADLADITESVKVLDQAVATAHRDSPGRVGYLANLASSLNLAARHDAYPGALDRAITTLTGEFGGVPAAHPLRHSYLIALGDAWLTSFGSSGEDRALEMAVDYHRQAARAVPDRHPHRAEYLARLGGALRRRFERSTDPADAEAAIAASRSAAAISTAPAVIRALAARDWGQIAAARGDAVEAMNGFSAAVNLLDLVAWRGLQRGDQERNLGRFAGLACDAAAWAIQAGQPERAVELLEQGRGVLLAQALSQRAHQHDLRRADPDLAGRLAALDDALEHLPTADDPLTPLLARRRDEVDRERDELLRQIRQLPGLADFLRPPGFAALREAAAEGPVVIINVSGYRCDALTVTTGGVHVTELAGLTGADVVARAAAFLGVLHSLQRAHPRRKDWRHAQEKTLSDTLAWLWTTIAEPLLPHLHAVCATSGRPRIWWCPTGPLTFLPLHAAGRHDSAGDSVLDHFVSSYTSTLRLLLSAREHAGQVTGHGRPLVVALPFTPGLAPIPEADAEASDFTRRFGGATRLQGEQATVGHVKSALEQAPSVAHFACHGTQDITSPAEGYLQLHDGPLAITDIAALRLDAAGLAFLSACETSRGRIQLSDEAITLATAFRLAGYCHVIGTLWSISDALAPYVARQVYRELEPPGAPGPALDSAVRSLREGWRAEPSLWAPYVHIGP